VLTITLEVRVASALLAVTEALLMFIYGRDLFSIVEVEMYFFLPALQLAFETFLAKLCFPLEVRQTISLDLLTSSQVLQTVAQPDRLSFQLVPRGE